MKKLKAISIVLIVAGFIIGVVLFVVGSFKPKSAGITIESIPASSVIIEGEQVGRTPYSGTRKPGEITIKLIPESFEAPLAPFETKVTLVAGIETVVKREFGETDETSSGEIISFEKIGGKEASLSVVSIPDAAQISIDGSIRGFAPYKTSSIVPGEHQVIVYAPGFTEKSFSLRATEGYKLTAVVKLKPNGEEILPEEGDSPEEPKQEEVEILSTPTGFLRVRSGPSTAGEEVAQVEPGDRFPYLETDEDTGWFKIEYADGEEGWVSNQYAKKVEPGEEDKEEPSPSPTPTASPKPSPTP